MENQPQGIYNHAKFKVLDTVRPYTERNPLGIATDTVNEKKN